MKKTIKVVGAIIENEKQEILCALRSFDMALSNYWEFPGGKLEKNETIQEAIVREIKEELSCSILAESSIYDISSFDYGNFVVELTTIKCQLIKGTLIPKEHQSLLWLRKDYLHSLNWAPADIPAVKKLVKEYS